MMNTPMVHAPEVIDYSAVVQQICRQYAAAQHGLPYDTMYARCM
jgi:hypothetical protein